MNGISRGIRNAFRNVIRTFSLVVILGISIGLCLSMLIAYRAVGTKIESVKASVGNTVSISPAGARGFEGGGTALTETQLATVSSLAHVSSVTKSLSDRLTTENTNLQSAVEAGSLGQRNAGNSGQSFEQPGGTAAPSGSNTAGSSGSSATAGSAGSGTAGTTGSATRSFTPPVTLIGTTDPTNLSSSSQGGGSFTLKSGKTFDGTSTENVALVGTTLAEKNSLSVGSTFTAYGKTVTVAGIFDAGNTFSNNQVLMPLAAVQTLSSQAGAVTSATVNVDSIDNVASVTTAVKDKLGTAADVTNAAERADETVKPLQNIRTISLYSLLGAVVAGAAIILLTMIMIVRERRREIGVLKAIGASNRTVVGQFMVETITLTMLGAVVGIVLGIVAGNPITKLLVNNASNTTTAASQTGRMGGGPGRAFGAVQNSLSNISANIGWEIIVYGLAAALAIAIIGSGIASFFIARVRPAEVLRSE